MPTNSHHLCDIFLEACFSDSVQKLLPGIFSTFCSQKFTSPSKFPGMFLILFHNLPKFVIPAALKCNMLKSSSLAFQIQSQKPDVQFFFPRFWILQTTMNASRPAGHLPSMIDAGKRLCFSHLLKIKGRYKYSQYKSSTFSLHSQLRLNLTVFNFASSNHHSEHLGVLEIISEFSSQKQFLKYDGIHSLMTIYPEFNLVLVRVNIGYFTTCFRFVKASMYFSVIDMKSVATKEFFEKQTNDLKYVFCFERVQHKLEIYHLVAAHHQYLKVLTSLLLTYPHSICVYDGPGKQSEQLHPKVVTSLSQIFYSTAFQVCIFANLNISIQINVSFTTETIQIPKQPSKRLYSHTNILSLCLNKNNPCIFRFSVQSNFLVNVSFSNFVQTGDARRGCDLAGISLFDFGHNNLHLIRTECMKAYFSVDFVKRYFTSPHEKGYEQYYHLSNISSYLFLFPNNNDHFSYFSNTNDIIVIFWSYMEFASLTFDLSLSETNCTTQRTGNTWLKYIHWSETCVILQHSCSNIGFAVMLTGEASPGKMLSLEMTGVFGESVFKSFCFSFFLVFNRL